MLLSLSLNFHCVEICKMKREAAMIASNSGKHERRLIGPREKSSSTRKEERERRRERERDQFLHPSRALDPFRRDISIERIVSFCPSEHSINILHMLSSATHIPVSHRFGRKRQSHDAIIFHPTPTLVCISPYSYFSN